MTVFKPSKFKTGASNQASATATNANSAVGANTPITILLEDFEIALSSSLKEDATYTIADLEDLVPELAASIKSLLAKFNVPVVDDAVALTYKHKSQELYRAICFAYENGLVAKFGDYQFIVPEETDITAKPYAFSGNKDHGWTLTLDKGGVNLPARCFISKSFVTKDTRFEAMMDMIQTAGALSDYLDRGEPIISWADMPKNTTVTVHSITPILDKETKEPKGGKLLAENSEGAVIQLWAPGEYADYAGIEFPVQATRDDTEFTINGRVLTVRIGGGKYVKLYELGIGEHKIVGFTSDVGQYGWQSTLVLADGRKVNGNKTIDRKLKSLKNPDDAITEDKIATLSISEIKPYTNKEGQQRHEVIATLMLAGDEDNELLKKLKARAAAASKKKAPAMVGNPL
jgi:hypothetical protein